MPLCYLGHHSIGAADMTKHVALYLRVSTSEQTTENQRQELQTVAMRAGWEIVEVYEDAGISGAKGRDQRPAFAKMLKDATRRHFDMIASWSVDRLGRSLQGLLGFITDIQAVGVDLYLHQQAIDTSTPSGKAMFQMCGVFAEFERSMIQERVNAGLRRAKAQGKKLGRPRVDPRIEEQIKERRQAGAGILRIAKEIGVGTSVVQRVVADMTEYAVA
jgi:DNA invertase Pin-like site-specific DNA recombinase